MARPTPKLCAAKGCMSLTTNGAARCSVHQRATGRGTDHDLVYRAIRAHGYGTCSSCGVAHAVDEIEIDHIIPLSCGGEDTLANLQLLCKECHTRKSQRGC